MKTIFIIFAIWRIFIQLIGFLPGLSIDSLKQELSRATTDKQKISIFYELANSYNFINADTAVFYAYEALHLAEKDKRFSSHCQDNDATQLFAGRTG